MTGPDDEPDDGSAAGFGVGFGVGCGLGTGCFRAVLVDAIQSGKTALAKMTGHDDGPDDGFAADFGVGCGLGTGCFRAIFTGRRATRFFGGGETRSKARLNIRYSSG